MLLARAASPDPAKGKRWVRRHGRGTSRTDDHDRPPAALRYGAYSLRLQPDDLEDGQLAADYGTISIRRTTVSTGP
jgi:hypothetical protein